MILTEIQTEHDPPFRLVFHPGISVIGTTPPPQRSSMAEEIVGVIQGTLKPTVVAFVRVGERIEQVTPELAKHMGLRPSEVTRLITMADLPGVVPEDFGEGSAVRQAREALASAEAYEQSLIGALEEVGGTTDSGDVGALTRAEEEYDNWTKRVEQLQDLFPTAVPDAAESERVARERSEKLERTRQAIERKIKELRTALETETPDADRIQRLLETLRVLPREERRPFVAKTEHAPLPEPLPTPTELVSRWAELANERRALEAEDEPPAWLVEATKRALLAAEARLKEVMRRRGADQATDADLHRAEFELRDASIAWAEVEEGKAGALRMLAEKEKEHWRIAAAVFNVEWEDPDWTPAERLFKALEVIGAPVSMETVEEDAERWLKANAEAEAGRAQLRSALAGAVMDLEEVKTEITLREALQGEVQDPSIVLRVEEDLAEALEGQRSALERLEAMRATGSGRAMGSDLYRPLHQKLERARESVERCRRKLQEEQERAGQSASNRSNSPNLRAKTKGLDPREIEGYLLARAAKLQAMGRGDAPPMVIDAAFDSFEAPTTRYLLDVLAGLAHAVQVIYLASTAVAEDWAFRQHELLAGGLPRTAGLTFHGERPNGVTDRDIRHLMSGTSQW